ncbi:hypothetical protein [Achromobacter sp. AGC39]
MDEILNYMKHRGWREDGQVIRSPKNDVFGSWSEAITACIYLADL